VKQLLQSLRNGTIDVAAVPCPGPQDGHVLITTSRTLISAGTERMLVDFGKAGFIEKARQQPDKVRMVLNKIRTDGLVPAVTAVLNKLDQPLAIGYSNVGTVAHAGNGVGGFSVGERVVSNGKHAEVVNVPANLCAKVPDSVSDDEAAFTIVGAIALQGIRLVQPTLGEAVVVTGLGLIGLMTVQLLRAHGCRVLGLDFDPAKLELARGFGAEVVQLSSGQDPVAAADTFSRGRGVDAVVITASTTSSEPVHQGAIMCRKRGRIVLVGVTGLQLSRADFYEKELTFQVSCSYGPGRYDPHYETRGHDYPLAFVRWTEQRNFEAVLDMLASGGLDVKPLISHRFAITDAPRAYEVVGGAEPSLGILLEYPSVPERDLRSRTIQTAPARLAGAGTAAVSFIGSGNYATSVLIPSFRLTGARLRSVASNAGVTGVHAARKFGFEETTTDTERVFADPETNAVVIGTRHDSHAPLVLRALAAGKHVFVEKPLCLTLEDVTAIEHAARASGRCLMVGFNRRFAPQVRRIKTLLAPLNAAKTFVMTVNAGAIPAAHWTQDPAVGGGRIVGEACHFIDLLRGLAGCPITGVQAARLGGPTGSTGPSENATLTLQFEDGSIGTIHYFANGHKAFPKERLEVFAGGRILQLDNFRKLAGFGWPAFSRMNLWRQDKGQAACAAAFVQTIERGGDAPIPLDELLEVSRISIEAAALLR
jgi:predicted dehydrogenase/threonine dehydrogenase-like Zn-dependent dehydrogenase